MTRLGLWLATCGGLGYFPIAPGTVGSAAGLAFYGALRLSGAGPILEAGTILALFAVGVWASTTAEGHFDKKDPGPVVIDEVVGQLMALAWLPVGFGGVVVGFFLFRLSDIVKPFPADRLESLPSGLGIMSDDAMAAVYANLALRAAAWLFPALLA